MSDRLGMKPEGPDAGAPDGPEMFEQDPLGALKPYVAPGSAGGRRMLGLSMPAAAIGVLLIGSIAFGAGSFGLAGITAKRTDPPVAPGIVLGDPGADKGDSTPDDAEKDPSSDTKPGGGSDKETPGTPTDEPGGTTPEPEALELDARHADGAVRVEWTACDPDGFAYYKLVRSSDESVTWPAGTGDTLVAAIEDQEATGYTDAKAGPGKHWYRVFALAKVDGALVVACTSNVNGASVPEPEPTDKPDEPDTKPSEKPTEKPTEKPDPEPTAGKMDLALAIKEGHPLVDWSACESSRFDAYKVLWSKDSTVSWPAGANDVLAGAIGDRETTKLLDTDAPAGKKLYYRVFCLDKTEDGYKVLASTGVKGITTPDAEPAPDPVSLSFEAGAFEGGVELAWEPCSSDAFVYYKVVRSASGNPSYLPWTDGTEVIAVIENAGVDGFVDEDVESGETWHYRVQAIGKWNGEKVVLGQTTVLEVTVP